MGRLGQPGRPFLLPAPWDGTSRTCASCKRYLRFPGGLSRATPFPGIVPGWQLHVQPRRLNRRESWGHVGGAAPIAASREDNHATISRRPPLKDGPA
jgi:hypothetical protein